MRILFAIPTLGAGGSERVAAILSAHWVNQGHAVTMLTLEAAGAPSHYPLADGVDVVQIGRPRSQEGPLLTARDAPASVLRLRGAIRRQRPDVVLSFITKMNVLILMASLGMTVPVIVSERVHPGAHRFGRLWERLRSSLYPRASGVCVQTEDIARWFRDQIGLKPCVLPNPFDPKPFAAPPPKSDARSRCLELAAHTGEVKNGGRGQWIVCLGRLDPQKGYDILLHAFAKVASRLPGWDVWVFGDGPSRSELIALRDHLGLSGRVYFPGVINDPASALVAADLFVHPARYEGTPNAVLEALACGCCVIASDSPGGTAEVLAGGRRGALVPVGDAAALGDAIVALAVNPDRRAALADRASEALVDLDARLVAGRWLDMLSRHAATPARG